MGSRLFSAAAWGFALAGYALLLADPAIALEGFGHPRLPAALHLFTLGVLVSGFYGAQERAWPAWYGRPAPWPAATVAAWTAHVGGVILMAAGFLGGGLRVANLGAHYLVPAGIALRTLQAVWAVRRRAPGTPRHAAGHLPLVGLWLAMALGSMLILSEVTGRYGLYTPGTLLVHGLVGGFLFALPALRVGAPEAAAARPWWPPRPGVLLPLGVALAAAGAWTPVAGLLALGLAALGGAVSLLGAPRAAPGRAAWGFSRHGWPWTLAGAGLLYAAWRSGAAPGEGPVLALRVGAWLLLGAAVPELLAGLGRHGPPWAPSRLDLEPHLHTALALSGTLLVGGAVLGAALPVRLGAAAGLVVLALLALGLGGLRGPPPAPGRPGAP